MNLVGMMQKTFQIHLLLRQNVKADPQEVNPLFFFSFKKIKNKKFYINFIIIIDFISLFITMQETMDIKFE
jgi:hypothetical protein